MFCFKPGMHKYVMSDVVAVQLFTAVN